MDPYFRSVKTAEDVKPKSLPLVQVKKRLGGKLWLLHVVISRARLWQKSFNETWASIWCIKQEFDESDFDTVRRTCAAVSPRF